MMSEILYIFEGRFDIENLSEKYNEHVGTFTDFVTKLAVDDLVMLSFDIEKPQPAFFQESSKKLERYQDLPLRQKMMASAAHPNYFIEAKFKGFGSFISGDSVSISPALFALLVAEEGKQIDLSKVRIVNVGSTVVQQDPVPEDLAGKKAYIKNFLKQQ